jgi:zinc transport system substrate-binding protein
MGWWPKWAALAMAVLGALGPASAGAAPQVVASVKPLHGLVAAVMEGVAEPRLLIGRGSPHGYSLRPSDARALRRAELVFWIGPGLEAVLEKPLRTLSAQATVVAMADLPGLRLLPRREGGAWDRDQHGPDDPDGHGPAVETGPAGTGPAETGPAGAETVAESQNLHIWLDPDNGRVMVEAIAAALARADPPNAERYRRNGAGTLARIEALDRDLRQRLAPVADRAYVVFHDGYHYFERHYGLNAVGSITVSPERAPGARRLREIRARIAELGAVCVFSEPQFEPALVATVVEGTSARTGTLDPLGAEIAPGPRAYFELMDRLAESLQSCLAATRGL